MGTVASITIPIVVTTTEVVASIQDQSKVPIEVMSPDKEIGVVKACAAATTQVLRGSRRWPHDSGYRKRAHAINPVRDDLERTLMSKLLSDR